MSRAWDEVDAQEAEPLMKRVYNLKRLFLNGDLEQTTHLLVTIYSKTDFFCFETHGSPGPEDGPMAPYALAIA